MNVWLFIVSLVVRLFTADTQASSLPSLQTEGDGSTVARAHSEETVRMPHTIEGWVPPPRESITAEHYVVMDKASGSILYSRDPNTPWPAASLTKLMTAIIFLDKGPVHIPWDDTITILPADRTNGTAYVYEGESLTLRDAFTSGLVGSLNTMAHVLVRIEGSSHEEYVSRMNARARVLGLWNTTFTDVTGLSGENMTTAKEAAWLLKEALQYEEIKGALVLPTYTFHTTKGRAVTVKSTNKLLSRGLHIEGGKTGFTTEAKYNFTMSVANGEGDAVIVAVLGSVGDEERFHDAETLASWAFTNYRWY